MRGARVLVVDDNPDGLEVTRLALASAGYRVLTAGDAEEAVRLIRARRPALVLLDVELPGRSGLDLARELKADPATAGIPIVALTAYAMGEDRQRALDAGCDGYLAKPVPIDTLVQTVARYLGAPP